MVLSLLLAIFIFLTIIIMLVISYYYLIFLEKLFGTDKIKFGNLSKYLNGDKYFNCKYDDMEIEKLRLKIKIFITVLFISVLIDMFLIAVNLIFSQYK
jgi:hypothetical protein